MRPFLALPLLLLAAIATAADKGPEDLKLSGPASAAIGELVRLRLDGLPNVELAKTMDQQLSWMSKVRVITSAPTGVTDQDYTLDQQLSIKVSPFQWTFALDFAAKRPGDYVIIVDWNEAPFGLSFHRISVGGQVVPPSDPTNPQVPTVTPSKIDRVTYVWEKDNGPIPRPVSAALQRINAEASGVVATEFEQNSPDGTGETPEQYKIALEVAKKVGLPALVVQSGKTVVTVVKDPKTEASVMEVVK
jgi:hypothetical protein